MTIPAIAIPFPELLWSFPWYNATLPSTTASGPTTIRQNPGRDTIPSTSDAVAKPEPSDGSPAVVPSIVNGFPQLLQLFAATGDGVAHRGQTISCEPSTFRRNFGALSPAAAYAWTGCGSGLMT